MKTLIKLFTVFLTAILCPAQGFYGDATGLRVVAVGTTNIISTSGSTISGIGITNGNVTIPGTLGVTGATTMGTLVGTTISGNGSGLSNAVDIIAGDGSVTIVTNAGKRSFTITAAGGTSGAVTNDETRDLIFNGKLTVAERISTQELLTPSNTLLLTNQVLSFRLAHVSGIGTNFIFEGAPIVGNGSGISNLNAAYISGDLSVDTLTAITLVVDAIDTPTNSWTINTAFLLGTNATFTSGAATGGIIGVANAPTNTARFGELNIKATGDITFTNPAAFYTSDYVDSRVITNGNTAVVAVSIIPGFSTNLAIVQFK